MDASIRRTARCGTKRRWIGWFNADFNYDGKINIDDYGIIDGNIGRQVGTFPTARDAAGVAAIAEPAGLVLLALVPIACRARRNRCIAE